MKTKIPIMLMDGMCVEDKRNTHLVQHNGTNGIFYSDFRRYFDEGISVIMLSNKSHPNFNSVASEITKIIFDPNYAPAIPIADNQANRAFTEGVIRITLNKGIANGMKAFKNRKKDLNVLEYSINNKGYQLLSSNKLDQAIDIFELNVFAFPKSANAFDSLGELTEAGNKELAIKNYRKSLSLNPDNGNAEDMLKQLSK